jgi:hypothetical protein
MDRTCSTHEEKRNAKKLWFGSLNGKDHLEDLGVDGMKILKCHRPLFQSPCQCSVKGTDYEIPHYAIFSVPSLKPNLPLSTFSTCPQVCLVINNCGKPVTLVSLL